MTTLKLEEIVEHRVDRRCGNLLGIQPFMTNADYVSYEAFYAKLDRYLHAAAQRGWLNPRTIVVWPEYIGTWLINASNDPATRQAQTLRALIRTHILRQTLHFARHVIVATERDKIVASIFRMRAEHMAQTYQTVFSSLARKHGITIVAGSTILPSPRVEDGKVAAGNGRLYNITAVYRPDGQAYPQLVRKVVPVDEECGVISPARPADIPVFDTPAGRLGVLICADSWFPATYERLKAQRTELVAVPSCIAAHDVWHKAWAGYSFNRPPADVNLADIGQLTSAQAWQKYALSGRIDAAGARCGINVFLRGELWDLGLDGHSTIALGHQQAITTRSHAGALLNLWL